MAVLLIAEHDNSQLKSATRNAASAALAMSADVDVLVAGHNAGAVTGQAAMLAGIRKILHADHAGLEHQLAEPLAALIVSLAPGYDAIVAPAGASGKNVMPRVAALLDVMQVSEIVGVVGPDTFERTIYAGSAIQTVRAKDPKIVVTVRGSAFPAVGNNGSAVIEDIGFDGDAGLSSFVGAQIVRSDRPELMSAKVIVSGGRGLGSAEAFTSHIAPVADRLGAAIGASRAAVDAGYRPNDDQIGQTGKVVAPDLYVAVGISGAIQHLAGMKDSKIIVAINSDSEAPIFQIADYGLVGDLFQILPELDKELQTAGY
jgi:electron transfer flavoprotein alpha subunit